MLKFTKMNGAGNDFVLLDNRDGSLRLDPKGIERLCDRHRGVGADGVLVVEAARNCGDFRMRYYNRDGGEAEMCGNGARCFARFASRMAGARERIAFETMAGLVSAEPAGDLIRLAMSEPRDLRMGIELPLPLETLTAYFVNSGVPHTVVFVEDLDNVAVGQLGAQIRNHAEFAPKGTNVNFVKRIDGRTIAVRTYERGVEDETLACGTGVVAAAIIFHETHGAGSPVRVRVRGGDTLEVGFERTTGGYGNVTLTGPAEFVFDGEIEL